VLNLGESKAVSEIDLKSSRGGSGNSLREIVLNFGEQSQSRTVEIDILA
jgi:hypothetical protein